VRDAKTQASREAERGEKEDAGVSFGVHPTRGVHSCIEDGRGVTEHKAAGAQRPRLVSSGRKVVCGEQSVEP
jgi:hypothetical protein